MRMTLGKAGWLMFAMGSFGLSAEARAQSTPYTTLPPVSPYATPGPSAVSPYGRPAQMPVATPQRTNTDSTGNSSRSVGPIQNPPLVQQTNSKTSAPPAPMPLKTPPAPAPLPVVTAPAPMPTKPIADEPSPAIVRLMQDRQRQHPNPPFSGADDYTRLVQMHVMLAWLADPITGRYPLKANANGSVLEVSGTVPNQAIHTHAVETAERISKMSVTDTVRVQPNATPPVPVVAAEQLQKNVENALADGPKNYVRDLKIQVHGGGVVSVTGAAPSYEHKLAVSQAVRGAAGCTAVDNQLMVRCFHYQGTNYTLVSADGRYIMPGLAPASPRVEPVEVVTMPSRPRPIENLAQAAKAALPGPAGRAPEKVEMAQTGSATAPAEQPKVAATAARTPAPASQPTNEEQTLVGMIRRYKNRKEEGELIVTKPAVSAVSVAVSLEKSQTVPVAPPPPVPVKVADVQLKPVPGTSMVKPAEAMAKAAAPVSAAAGPKTDKVVWQQATTKPPAAGALPPVKAPPVPAAPAKPIVLAAPPVPPQPVPGSLIARLSEGKLKPAPASTAAQRPYPFGNATPAPAATAPHPAGKDTVSPALAATTSGMPPKPVTPITPEAARPASIAVGAPTPAPAPAPGKNTMLATAPVANNPSPPVTNNVAAAKPATTNVAVTPPAPLPAVKPAATQWPTPAKSPYAMAQARPAVNDAALYDYPLKRDSATPVPSKLNTLVAAANTPQEVTPARHESVTKPAAATFVFQEKPAMAVQGAVTSGVVVAASADELPQTIPDVAQAALESWLKDRVSLTCGTEGRDLEVVLRSTTHMTVDLKARDAQAAQHLSRKILAMPELEPYRVTLKVQSAQ